MRSVLFFKINVHNQWRIQDFPEEGAPTPRGGAPTYDFTKFSQKLHEIERIWAPGGHASLAPPLDPPLITVTKWHPQYNFSAEPLLRYISAPRSASLALHRAVDVLWFNVLNVKGLFTLWWRNSSVWKSLSTHQQREIANVISTVLQNDIQNSQCKTDLVS